MWLHKFWRSLLAALLFAPLACSTLRQGSDTDRASLLTTRNAPLGRNCHPSQAPATLPTVGVIVDSVALGAALAALRDAGEVSAGYAVLSMAYDTHGINIRRDVIEHNLPAPTADTLQQLVFAHRKQVPGSEHGWGVRLRIDFAEPLRFAVGRRELCAPSPRDGDWMAMFGDAINARDRFRPFAHEGTVWIRLLVDRDGSVRDARVERGMVSGPQENRLLHFVRTLAFDPALDDGVPVPGWITVPVPMRVP